MAWIISWVDSYAIRLQCQIIFISWTFNGLKLDLTYNATEDNAIYYKPKNQEWNVDKVGVAWRVDNFLLHPYTITLRTVYDVRCTTYSVRRTVYDVQCTTYSIRRTVYDVQCTTYSVRRTVYDVRCTSYTYTSYTPDLSDSDMSCLHTAPNSPYICYLCWTTYVSNPRLHLVSH